MHPISSCIAARWMVSTRNSGERYNPSTRASCPAGMKSPCLPRHDRRGVDRRAEHRCGQCCSFTSVLRSVDQGGENLPDISAVLADHGDRIAAVVLAQEGTAVAELEGL